MVRKLRRLPLVLALVATPLVVATASQAQPTTPHVSGEVHLATVANDLDLAHTIRHTNRYWDRFGLLRAGYAYPRKLASAIVDGEEHLLYDTEHGTPSSSVTHHRIRHADGTWSDGSTPFSGLTGPIAVAAVAGELHVVKRQEGTGGRLYHSKRHADGTWSELSEVPVEDTWDVSAANVGGKLQLVTTHPWSTTLTTVARHADGTWTPAADVTFPPRPRVVAATVDIAQVGAELHVVVLTTSGGLFHTIRRPNGGWTVFGNVDTEAGGTPGTISHVAVTAARDTLHVAVATSEGGVFHTIRFTNRQWSRIADVKGEAGTVTSREVTIAGDSDLGTQRMCG